MIEISVKLINI